MSSGAYLEWHYLAHDDFDMASISDHVDALVSRLGLPRDVAGKLKELFEVGETQLELESGSIIEILDEIAHFAPKVAFAVRSLGHAPRMIWVREYEHGQERFSFGPPKGAEAAAERDLALFDAAIYGGTAPWPELPPVAEFEASRARLVAWFRRSLADAPELAALIDPGPGLTLVDVNKTYEAIAGRPREQIIGKSLFGVPLNDSEYPDIENMWRLFASLRAVAESGRSRDMGIQRFVEQDAEGVWIPHYWRPVTTPLNDDEGRLTLLLHIAERVAAPASGDSPH